MPPTTCRDCGCELAPALKSCPRCGSLVHATLLKNIAAEAEVARGQGRVRGEREAWTRALTLLPRDSQQYAVIAARIAELPAQEPADDANTATQRTLGFAGLVILLLSKGKWVLSAFPKAWPALLAMAASFGVYWTAYGWQFAGGILGSIFLHELGHIAMLRWYGIGSSFPMFIPGIGAFIRPDRAPKDARQNARIGLAGPVAGLLTAALVFAVFVATELPVFGAIAKFGAIVNLFNLLPMPPLDGGAGIRSLNIPQRWFLAFVICGAWMLTNEGYLVLILLLAVVRCFQPRVPKAGDLPGLALYAGLVIALSFLGAVVVEVK
ncbi:MAG: site-2 protease family protein [Planctomycetota bacterium]